MAKTVPVLLPFLLSLLTWSPATSSSPEAYDSHLFRATENLRHRVAESLPMNEVVQLGPGDIEAFLSDEERLLFSQQYLQFVVNQPVRVWIFVDQRLNEAEEPFWLRQQGFVHRPNISANAFSHTFEAWEKYFPAGEIGLGIHAFRSIREHYFVVVSALDDVQELAVKPLLPEGVALYPWEVGSPPWSDRSALLESLVPSAQNPDAVLLAPLSGRRSIAEVYGYFRSTKYPATDRPDQLSLTLSEDPSQSIYLQWRQSGAAWDEGAPIVEFWQKANLIDRTRGDGGNRTQVPVTSTKLPAGRVLNAENTARLWAELAPLRPDTEYQYHISTEEGEVLAGPYTFRSAPSSTQERFHFLYFGDVQEDYDTFIPLLDQALRSYPDPAFITFAGDLVSRGTDQDDWDAFFAAIDDRLAGIPLAPAIGNHELFPGDDPGLYLKLFQLPQNGPDSMAPGRAWFSQWGQVGLVVLDSNEDGFQAQWLEKVFDNESWSASFAVAHHGAYTSRPGRYHWRMSEQWAPILEQRGVSLVLQGHDHAYLRTHPMRTGQVADVAGFGTTYVIATAGGKFYPQAQHGYAAKQFSETRTFQVIEFEPGDYQRRLKYRAYSETGELLDSFEMTAPGSLGK